MIYQQLLNLHDATFTLIAHEDAMVATVFKITKKNGEQLILKISERPNDYFREALLLKMFADFLPVPKIIQLIEPTKNIHGAILMEFLQGSLLKPEDLTETLSHEIGRCLAIIHQKRLDGYGDPVQGHLPDSPLPYFTSKFKEGLEECKPNLPAGLIHKCLDYFETHVALLNSVDGPCVVHRDFRPGNIIVHEGQLQGIIDWAGARASFAEEDLCGFEHGEWAHSAYSIKSILAGYASVRPVPDFQSMSSLLRLYKAIATIGFTVKSETWETTASRLYQYNREYLEQLFGEKA